MDRFSGFEPSPIAISKEDFLRNLKAQDDKHPSDKFARHIYDKIEKHHGAEYFKALLNERGFGRLIVPWHNHGTSLVPPGGSQIATALTRYCELKKTPRPECIEKIANLVSLFRPEENPIRGDFLFVSNHGELVHPGHYRDHGPWSLYTGNGFHRFLAFAWWRERHPHKALEVHYLHDLAFSS